jgi:hypothetical protein
MHNCNTTTCTCNNSLLIETLPGVRILVDQDSKADYLEMRAAQLSALNHLMTSADFCSWDATIQADAKWLAASLAAEVSNLVRVVTIGENLRENKLKV